MIKAILLSIIITFSPFLNAEGGELSNASLIPRAQSIFVVSDFEGILFLDGTKVQNGKIKANAATPFEIKMLRPNTYHLELNDGRHEGIECDVPVETGQDTYVHLRIGISVVGHSMQEISYHPTKQSFLKLWIAGGVVLLIGALLIWFNQKGSPFYGATDS